MTKEDTQLKIRAVQAATAFIHTAGKAPEYDGDKMIELAEKIYTFIKTEIKEDK